MHDIDLLQLALGITSPWFVSAADFDGEGKRLDIRIDFMAGSRFACPDCGKDGCPAHDTTEKTWRHLDFFQHQASLTARVPRGAIQLCRIRATVGEFKRSDDTAHCGDLPSVLTTFYEG
jgi:transposase